MYVLIITLIFSLKLQQATITSAEDILQNSLIEKPNVCPVTPQSLKVWCTKLSRYLRAISLKKSSEHVLLMPPRPDSQDLIQGLIIFFPLYSSSSFFMIMVSRSNFTHLD